MFTIDEKITEGDLKERNLFKAFFSMNTHQVATPEMSLEEARSYVFIFHEGRKRLSAYIGIHLLITDRKLFYVQSANPFLEDEVEEIEEEALTFAESLGAMLDEVDLTDLSDSEKQRWIKDQGIFAQKKEAETPAAAPVPEPQPEEIAPMQAAAPVQPVPVQQPAPVVTPQPEAQIQHPQIQQPPPIVQQPAAPVVVDSVPSVSIPRETVAPVAAPVTTAPEVEQLANNQNAAPAMPSTKPLAARAVKRQDVVQKTVHAANVPPQKKSMNNKETPSSTGVVSRDREALARLLTSF